MATLPAERLDICVPFEVTGVDIFAPFGVKNGGRATHKQWVMLFTCLGCRDVHFKMLKDMSSSTAINAITKFHLHRPGLCILYSDNGTNFRGADNKLKRAMKNWNQCPLVEKLQLKGIKWKFGPPTPRIGVASGSE
jgi:hypothetical protein